MRELFTIPSPPIAGAYLTASYISSLYLNRILDAESSITSVEAIADGKINTYLQNSNVSGIPSPSQTMQEATGDLWIDSYDSHPSYHKNNVFRFRYVTGTESITGYFYTGSAWDTTYREDYSVTDKYIWEDIADLGIATAILNAGNAQTAADDAQSAADDAQTDATSSIDLLTDIASDSEITPVEKLQAKEKWNLIPDEAAPTTGTIIVQANNFSVSSTDFASAYSALNIYLNTTIAVFSNMTTTTTITRATWDSKWEDYYNERTDLLNAIAAKAKSLADDAQTTADTKIVTFYDTSPPTPDGNGDLWVDISSSKQNMFRYKASYTGNNPGYKWSGSSWGSYLDDVSSSGSDCWLDIDDIKIFQKSAVTVTVSLDADEGDYQTIESAITALPSAGGTVLIKNGTYSISSSIELAGKSITFTGENKEQTILQCTTNLSNGIFYRDVSTPDPDDITEIFISNITFDGDGTVSKAVWFSSDASGFYISSCIFTGLAFATEGVPVVHIARCLNFSFINNYLDCDSEYSMLKACPKEGGKITVSDNVFQGNSVGMQGSSSYGVSHIDIDFLYSSSGLTNVSIVRNKFFDITGLGINVGLHIAYADVSFNEIHIGRENLSGSYYGIVVNADTCNVSNNLVETSINTIDGSIWGIKLSEYVTEAIVSNNIFKLISDCSTAAYFYGIEIHNNVNLNGNLVDMSWVGTTEPYHYYGIFCYEDENRIIGNHLKGNGGTSMIGIYLTDIADYNIMSSNIINGFDTDIDDNSTSGTNVESANVTV